MRHSIPVVVVIACTLSAGCGRDRVKPTATVSIVGHSPATETLTYRIRNNLDRPVFLQLQSKSGIGHYLQGRQMQGGASPDPTIPVGQNLGTATTKLPAGQTIDFNFVYESQRSFRVGIVYSLSTGSGGTDWNWCWSGWFDDLTAPEPAAAADG